MGQNIAVVMIERPNISRTDEKEDAYPRYIRVPEVPARSVETAKNWVRANVLHGAQGSRVTLLCGAARYTPTTHIEDLTEEED